MERLTRKSDSGMVWFIDREHESGYAEREPCEMDAHHSRLAIEKLAEYEDLEEQGKLLHLPLTVGETYYRIENNGLTEPYITEWRANTVQFCVNAINSIGISIFLTRKEAEEKLKKMGSKFKCKAEKAGYCDQWKRECVSWNNCNLSGYEAPCPGCVASSPLDHERCSGCKYKKWKQDNYCE